MATKKKSRASARKKTSKKAARKTSSKKTAKKTSKKKAGKKTARKSASRSAAPADDDFAVHRAELAAGGADYSSSSYSEPSYAAGGVEEEGTSSLARFAILAVLGVLIIVIVLWANSSDSPDVEPGISDETTTSQVEEPESQAEPVVAANEEPETAVETPANQTGGGTYVVRAGDNFYKIAREQMGAGTPANVSRLLELNNLTTNSQLRIGQELRIPQ